MIYHHHRSSIKLKVKTGRARRKVGRAVKVKSIYARVAVTQFKAREPHMDVSIIQQVKIQARVLVPLVKALQTELGEERANALVRRALGAIYHRYSEEFWRAKNEKNLGKAMGGELVAYARDDALD